MVLLRYTIHIIQILKLEFSDSKKSTKYWKILSSSTMEIYVYINKCIKTLVLYIKNIRCYVC